MRKASIVLIFLLVFSLLPYSSAQGDVKISNNGFVLEQWEINSKNIIDAGDRGALGKSYPLWDWLLSEPWPGSLATKEYQLRVEGEKIIGTTEVGDLFVEKIFEQLDENRARLTVRFTNNGKETFKSETNWDGFSLGYAMAWAGYLGKPGGEKQIWVDDELHVDNKNWVRLGTKLKAFGLVDFEEDLIALIFPKEESKALWLESSGWGSETRAEFAPLELNPGESKTYVFEIFVGTIEDVESIYPEIYRGMIKYISKEKFKIIFEVPDFPIEGEKITIKIRLIPKEPLNETAELKAQLVCSEKGVSQVTVPVSLEKESETTLEGAVSGVCKIKATLELKDEVISSAEKEVSAFKKEGTPLYVVFIWHHHQSPGVWPNGTLHGPWALVHTYEDELYPYYPGGAYYFHAYILQKYPQIKMTYHLSPSLLWQWNLTKSGWCQSYPQYQCFTPDSAEAKRVQETIELYKQLYERGQIDILSSYFAHPISGYIAEKYGWFDLLDYELNLGMKTTEEVMNIKTNGMWLPEMAFSPKLAYLFDKYSIKYFPLDDRCHLRVLYPYSPYHLYKLENSSTLILFRDHSLSDEFAFNNNFRSEEEAREKAKEIVEKILSVRSKDPSAEVVTIAADGENWIIFSNNPPLTAFYFEALLQYLEEAQEKGLLKTVTFREATLKLKPYQNVTPLATSWLCSWDKWTRERKNLQEPMWKRDEKVYTLIQEYKEKCSKNEVYYKALYGLSQAMDSDFYWAEFIFDKHVYAWLNWTEETVNAGLAKCEVSTSSPFETTTTVPEEGICGPVMILAIALVPLVLRRRL
ncbi:hypothetical protein PAP_05690 [Palaeococcus pacificus DY20341]|uniref:Glycoside hydrolase family 57 N-terminal domain-containing protein n=1 Tax=Palaeococcus pacificus DY20341 TaxID=1343739 RepID=A0A075LY74_9EURY|nr:CGP-CTERM sorting domain-containing protein [Palaeococcus pacificus]AIF69538.1 hypothetical protein PAP_05690 [Palaeococcus pacificus DY20341]